MHRAEGSNRNAGLPQKRLFSNTVLGNMQHPPGGTHERNRLGRRGTFGGDILKLKSKHVHGAGELTYFGHVIVSAHILDVGDCAGRRMSFRRIDVDAITHLSRRESEHPPQLA